MVVEEGAASLFTRLRTFFLGLRGALGKMNCPGFVSRSKARFLRAFRHQAHFVHSRDGAEKTLSENQAWHGVVIFPR